MKLPQLSLRDLFWLVALVATGCGDSSQPKPPPAIPVRQNLSHVYKALDESPAVYLYSLFPNQSDASDSLGGWQSMGNVKVEGDSRTRMATAFKAATEYETGKALCFEPHHGIRIRAPEGEQDMDLVICFTCHQFELHIQGDNTQVYSIDESAWPLFNRLLKEAKLPYEGKLD